MGGKEKGNWAELAIKVISKGTGTQQKTVCWSLTIHNSFMDGCVLVHSGSSTGILCKVRPVDGGGNYEGEGWTLPTMRHYQSASVWETEVEHSLNFVTMTWHNVRAFLCPHGSWL
jgi:hypothetical protein